MSLEVIEIGGLRWYLVEGKKLVSVTTALGWVFHWPGWAKYDLTAPNILFARNRGRAVHKACYWMSMGRRLREDTIDPVIEPYVFQFAHFLQTTQFRAEAAEFLVYSKKYGYAGRGDIKGFFPTDTARHFLDVKTGETVEDWLAGFQTAAYLNADREMTKDMRCAKRSVLHLNGGAPDKWRLRGPKGPDDFTMFLSALNCFKEAERRSAL